MPSRQLPDPADPPELTSATLLPDNRHQHHHQTSAPMVLSTALAAAISLAAAVALVVLLYRRISRSRAARTAPDDLKSNPSQLCRFTYDQLRRATASFSPSCRLGQGGFGPVFRGALPSGQEVAVKLMDSGALQGEREFQNELALAGKMVAMGCLPDRAWVVAPLGFCCSDKRQGRWWRRKRVEEVGRGVSGKGRRFLLVYELMHNGSLQDALLDRRCPELMDWGRRFSVAVDIARGLHFLHAVCDPPVIHGDIKPSNILLDSSLSARIADFGLARLKTSVLDDAPASPRLNEEVIVVEIDLDQEADTRLGKNRKKVPAGSPEISSRNDSGCGGGGEDEASVMGETADSTMTTGFEETMINGGNGVVTVERSQEEADEATSSVETAITLEVVSTSEAAGFDRMSVDSGTASGSQRGDRKNGGVFSAKDWWWRQDFSGEWNPESACSVKDYVMEWIRSEIRNEPPKSDWITATAVSTEDCLPRPSESPERKKQQRRLKWWASLDEGKLMKKEKCRTAREWWREEFCEELTNKQKRRVITKSHSIMGIIRGQDEKRKKNGGRSTMDSASGEKRTTGRRSSRESGTVSSTPSMRGTVCYVAPEYGGGGGPLSEKCDVYSFGVVLLVVVSGRRPLQVTTSPMTEFERANLISWARHLAHLGRLLDLVDPSLRGVDRDQALLCITVALLCIQRSPTRRPSIKKVVRWLTGQSEPPQLPLEFSPPGGSSFKSQKKAP